MNTYLFLYQETSFFEVVLAAYFMKTKGEVRILSDEKSEIHTNEGVKIIVDCTLEQVKAADIDVLLICGGNIGNIRSMEQLHRLIEQCHAKQKIIGGICAGREIVGNALHIANFENKTQTIGNVILSPGHEYVDFALAVGKAADIYADEADYQETVDYFKYFREV